METFSRDPGNHYNDDIMSAMASQITSLTIVYSTVCWGADLRQHQSSASLAFVKGIHRKPVNSPHKGPVKRKKFPFDDVIMSHPKHTNCLISQARCMVTYHIYITCREISGLQRGPFLQKRCWHIWLSIELIRKSISYTERYHMCVIARSRKNLNISR